MGTQRIKRNDEIVSLGIGKNDLGQFSGKSTLGYILSFKNDVYIIDMLRWF